MKTRTVASILAGGFILVLLQLVALLVHPIAGVLCGALIAVLAWLILKFFEIELQPAWTVVLLPTISSLVGVAIVFFAKAGQELYIWFASLLALAGSLLIAGIGYFASKRCGLCNRRLRSRIAFNCPRCGLMVCDHSCWDFDSSRCKLCMQNGSTDLSAGWKMVGPPVGATDHPWPLPTLPGDGRRSRFARLPKVRTPAVRECWDSANGQCSRCQWAIEDLPESLRPYILTASRAGREEGLSARDR